MNTPAIKSFETQAGKLSIGYKEEEESIAIVYRLTRDGANFGFSLNVPVEKFDVVSEKFEGIDQSEADKIASFLLLDKEVMRIRGGLVVSGLIH